MTGGYAICNSLLSQLKDKCNTKLVAEFILDKYSDCLSEGTHMELRLTIYGAKVDCESGFTYYLKNLLVTIPN